MKVIEKDGDVQWDGTEWENYACVAWIAAEYYDDERSKEAFRDGLLHTGDVVTFDEEGFVKIVDRIKDIIENGGKWISSVDLENNLMAQEAMVIAVPHLEWRERSIACAVIEEGKTVAKRELYDFL